jgi:hypothetical protein
VIEIVLDRRRRSEPEDCCRKSAPWCGLNGKGRRSRKPAARDRSSRRGWRLREGDCCCIRSQGIHWQRPGFQTFVVDPAILWLDACRDPEQEVRMKEGSLGPNMPCVESLCQQRATESSRSSWLRGIQIYLYRPRWLLLMAPRVRLGSRLCVCARHLRGMCGRTESESGRNNVQLATNPATCRCT